MNFDMRLFFSGIFLLVLAAFFFIGRKRWSNEAADQIKMNRAAKLFRFNFSAEYFALGYTFAPVFFVPLGLLMLVKAVGAPPGSPFAAIETLLLWLTLIVAFVGVPAFIIYVYWRFSE